jgi:hypothetical protein
MQSFRVELPQAAQYVAAATVMCSAGIPQWALAHALALRAPQWALRMPYSSGPAV